MILQQVNKIQILFLIKIIFLVSTINFTSTCVIKAFPNSESFVCVCNEESCDSINTFPNSLTDHLTIYTTDKAAHRFAKSLINVNDLVYNAAQLADFKVLINITDRRQSIFGFGGAFTDSAGININKLPEKLIDHVIGDYFDPVNGLGYTFGRVPIAASDFSNHSYTYDDFENDFELKNFKLTQEDYNIKIPLIKQAANVSSDLKLFSAPWAPPKWLKTSAKYRGLGILKGEPGSKYWKTYANYLVKFLEAYQAAGINFWGISPQNEPATGLIPNWPLGTCGFSGPMMRDWIKKDLGPALDDAGFGKDKVNLMIWDDQLEGALSFVRSVLNDAEASKYVSGIAYHWYSKRYYEFLDEMHETWPNIWLLSTEASEGVYQPVRVSFGNWTRAENYATDIIAGLNRWSTGWVDWNLALDEEGGPNWVDNFIDALVIVNNTSPEYYKQPLFYVFGHFSRFLVPGSTHVSHKIMNGDGNQVKMTTFISPSNEIIFTFMNKCDTAVRVSIEGITDKPFIMAFEPRSISTIIKPL